MEATTTYLYELLTILNEMSPYLVLGFLISGLLHVYVPRTLYSRFLHRKGFGSVMGAAILGVPLPLCSCGVIPTSMSLKKEGASDGATVAFLVGTPQTGVDSILATYSLLGLPFAIIRPVAAFVVAIFSGVMVDTFGSKASKKIDYNKLKFTPQATPASEPCSCGCSHNHTDEPKERTIRAALKYGFVDMMQDFGKWLVVGLLIAAAITAFIPDSVFAIFKDHYMLNILLIIVVSAPMYICATGSIPIALSLIMKGVSPGAAFVLLMAGPATNTASLIILKRGIGGRKTLIYLGAIILGAIACALIIDFILPQEWFSSLTHLGGDCTHYHDHGHEHHDNELCTHGPVWWQTTTSIIFIVLFANSIIRKWLKKDGGCCSHNH
ncbi:MAG: SO_0444 family Cu/Zn efflux transporter [Rikenellaceae bacterium]